MGGVSLRGWLFCKRRRGVNEVKKSLLLLMVMSTAALARKPNINLRSLKIVEPQTVILAKEIAKAYTRAGGLNKEVLSPILVNELLKEVLSPILVAEKSAPPKSEWRQEMETLLRSSRGLTAQTDNSWFSLLSTLTYIPLITGLKNPMLWEMLAPDGSQHFLLATVHHRVNLATLPETHRLFEVVDDEATTFLAENHDYHFEMVREFKKRINQLKRQKLLSDKSKAEQALTGLRAMLDHVLTEYGKSKGKRLVSLDQNLKELFQSSEDYMSARGDDRHQALQGLSAEEQIDYHLTLKDSFFRSYQAFADGDVAEYRRLTTERDPHVHIINDDRNKKWLKVIEETCKGSARCLIYGGANHFVVGEENTLLQLLTEKGYEIRRI